jgi:hypothetical protein
LAIGRSSMFFSVGSGMAQGAGDGQPGRAASHKPDSQAGAVNSW